MLQVAEQGLRCQDKLYDTQCEEPLGHSGAHFANKGTMYVTCWTSSNPRHAEALKQLQKGSDASHAFWQSRFECK